MEEKIKLPKFHLDQQVIVKEPYESGVIIKIELVDNEWKYLVKASTNSKNNTFSPNESEIFAFLREGNWIRNNRGAGRLKFE